MRNSTFASLAFAAALLAALGGPASAQSTPQPADRSNPTQRDAPQPSLARLPSSVPGLTLATRLKGVSLVDADSKTLGKVEDLIVESSGKLVVIVDRDAGGLVAVPIEQLQARFDLDDDAPEEAVEARSEGQRPESPRVESFLLVKPELLAAAEVLDKEQLALLDEATIENIRRHWAGQEAEPDSAARAAKPAETTKSPKSAKAAETALRYTCLSRAVGAEVKSPTAEQLGQVKDVVVDLAAHQVAYVLVSTGGVLGVGETVHGVALEALAHNGDHGYTLQTDRKTLDSSPGIDLDRLPSHPSLQITAKASLTDGSFAQGTRR